MAQSSAPVILITGGAKRIGALTARYLHHAGYNVVIHYRQSKKEAEQLAIALNEHRPDSAKAIDSALDTDADCRSLVDRSAGVWGELNALLNNASIYKSTPIGTINHLDIAQLFNINFQAPLLLAQAARSYLNKTEGVIINITDIHAIHPMRNYSVYCATKASLQSLTLCLAKELAPKIRVNAVAPGLILWPEGENVLGDDIKDRLVAQTALKKLGNPTAIAKAVLSLIENDYITGQILSVDGGRFL